ncbi:MAG: hypothetical protein UR28_C0011G0012 [Candidatus Peregrinibacteria bacterium GW2011_GWF2_33_10]|nr:MAG: hypothetical protein UR28_C0011G0012 [Candidatus Peregrinibacteria bacterium GW2011_GWF2_33_10]OGJ44289.1 MAG: hypothetical protein A2272_05520 [Candidatus Peregrinibacteria bacterium RIFOXYA12_FULL_33_12]OGJ44664.1 MAG: hypothetical protein A2263_00960 [Candidatus Peregrinibacteria bacterium RIFOXYA2_FULL_33_21]OGJ50398.1 MAG: hypothetical protein A2307_06020 [Candidatus Peregrinibacteria bacterium RIFOXYB2_FULL_33_20]
MNKFLKIFFLTLILISVFSVQANADLKSKISNSQAQEKLQQIQQNLPDEVENQISAKVYQIFYTILGKAINKGNEIIVNVNQALDLQIKMPQDIVDQLRGELDDLDKFLQDEDTKLKQAKNIDDLKDIANALVVEMQKVVFDAQVIALKNVDIFINKADSALLVLQTTCGADITQAQIQLGILKSKLDEYENQLEDQQKLSKEEMQIKLANFDPQEIRTEINTLKTEIETLSTSCQ